MRFFTFLVPLAAATTVAAYGISNAPAASKEQPFLLSTTQYLETGEGTLAYDDTQGTGPAVICVPGMGDFRGQYRYLAPRLASAGYRVITMDVRGHGESSVDWKEWDATAVGRDILALMDSLGLKKVHLIGNSFAAGAVYWAAVQAPERVVDLVLLDPVMRDGKPHPLLNLVLHAGLADPWGVSFWLAYWDGLFPVKKPQDFAAYRAALKASMSEPGRLAALRNMAFASKAPVEAILGKAKAPILIVMGSKDKDFPDPKAEADFLAEKTGARAEMLEAGHYPHVEWPLQTGDLVLGFLGSR